MKRRFIEYDLPLADISEESAREKNIRHGHPSTLHIWWARRPLSASRATAFASLIDDPGPENPEMREELSELIRSISSWNTVKNSNSPLLRKAVSMISKQYGRELPRVIDPFSGGGSIPLEAARLGCDTFTNDYNPVAVFVEKLTVEWPHRFGINVVLPNSITDPAHTVEDVLREDATGASKQNLLAAMVKRWSAKLYERAAEKLQSFYPLETSADLVGSREIENKEGWVPVGYIWARTIPCQNPNCGAEIPLVKTFWLRKKKNQDVAYRPIVGPQGNISFEVIEGQQLTKKLQQGFDPAAGTVSRANAECLVCGQVTKAKQVRELARNNRMGERLAVAVLRHPDESGKKYRAATAQDDAVFDAATQALQSEVADWEELESALPDEEMTVNSRYMLPTTYGLTQWKELYNSRQQLAMLVFCKLIREAKGEIEAEARTLLENIDSSDPRLKNITSQTFATAIQGYMGAVLSNLADFNSTLCTLNYTGGRGVLHTFSRHALSMTWDYMETNVLNPAGASWTACAANNVKALESLSLPSHGRVTCLRGSATELPRELQEFDAILTDPPYYDNVPYAALSDFFYVWLKRSVGDSFPALFGTPLVPKSKEAVMEPDRHSSTEQARSFFEDSLGSAFSEMHRAIKPGGIAVVVYAHKTTEGWETMLNGLVQSGFVVTASWPLHTEKKGRLREMASAALSSSIYMVCRKVEREEVGFWNDIQHEIKDRVEEKLEQFWNAGIAGGDFFISAIGPGMEAYSRYEEVQTYDGSKVSVLDLLQFIRGVATDFLVHRLLKDASAEALEKEAQFYLTYRWTFMDNRVEFDDARKIASAEGVDLEPLWDDDGFIKKTTKYIYVHGPQDRKEIESVDNMVDAMHVACKLWEKGDKDGLDQMLKQSGYGKTNAFWQFCQAVAECYVNGNKEKQLLEGLLLGKEKHMKAAEEGQTELL